MSRHNRRLALVRWSEQHNCRITIMDIKAAPDSEVSAAYEDYCAGAYEVLRQRLLSLRLRPVEGCAETESADYRDIRSRAAETRREAKSDR